MQQQLVEGEHTGVVPGGMSKTSLKSQAKFVGKYALNFLLLADGGPRSASSTASGSRNRCTAASTLAPSPYCSAHAFLGMVPGAPRPSDGRGQANGRGALVGQDPLGRGDTLAEALRDAR